MKKCTKCNVEKSTTEFSKQTASKDGLQCHCKKCFAAGDVRYRTANPDAALQRSRKHKQKLGPERRRLAQLKCRHGITAEELSRRMTEQKSCCAVCEEPFLNSKNTHIDHIHGSNPRVIRGILCQHCNTGLGQFKDSPEKLAKAVAYLKKFQKTA